MDMDVLGEIITIVNLIATVVLALLVFQFTKKSHTSATTSAVKDLINQFDVAILESDENVNAISELRAPAPGFTKRQEHLMFIYLNHVESALYALNSKLIDKEIFDQYCEDCLSYFRDNPDALYYQLGCGYPAPFVQEILVRYQKLYSHQMPDGACIHPTLREEDKPISENTEHT